MLVCGFSGGATDIGDSVLVAETSSLATGFSRFLHRGKARLGDEGEAFTSRRVSYIGAAWASAASFPEHYSAPVEGAEEKISSSRKATAEVKTESCRLSRKWNDKVQLAIEF